MAEDHSISEKVKDLAKDNLFMKERIYFKESINENTKIKIGGKLLKFYNELVELEELLTHKDEVTKLSHPITVPGAVINLKEVLSAAADGAHAQHAKREV